MKYFVYTLLLFLVPELIFSQNPNGPILTAGPLSGSVTSTSAKVWIAYKGAGDLGVKLVDTTEHTIYTPTMLHKTGNTTGDTAVILDYTNLKAGHSYRVTYDMPSLKNTPDCQFTTQIDVPVKDLDFLVGSCALLTTGFWRAFFPGADIRIYKPMAKARANFMVWLGDNIYYLGKDYKNYNNMFARNMEVRQKFRLMRNFLAAQPNYTIWDDHDYGWNDADKNFPNKEAALAVYRGFWPNTYESNVHETYFTFRYNDAEFFMTDGRWYRDAPGDTTAAFLGDEQLNWLKAKLLKSDATFKFVCVGSQVLNDNHHGESYAQYPVERNKLLDYIADNDIKGVIFLTGDKHYSELAKRDWKGYPLYDFTASPISSPVIPRQLLKSYRNPHSIKGTVIYQKNYGRVMITGPAGSRVCKLAIYGKSGKLKWDYVIKSEELRRK